MSAFSAPGSKDAVFRPSNWLADAKKFNAQRIRRRMKEQQERFGADNKQPQLTEEDGEELFHPHDDTHKVQQPPPAAHDPPSLNFRSKVPPHLNIAVTVSEEEPSPTSHGHQSTTSSASTATASPNNVSAWAMMEHYQLSQEPQAYPDYRQQQQSDESVVLGSSMVFEGSSPSFIRASGSELTSHGSSNESSKKKDTEEEVAATPSPRKASRIQWQISEEENETLSPEQTPQTTPKPTTQDFFPNPYATSTPARIANAWRSEQKNDVSSFSGTSLMQESALLSATAVADDFVSVSPPAVERGSPAKSVETTDSNQDPEDSEPSFSLHTSMIEGDADSHLSLLSFPTSVRSNDQHSLSADKNAALAAANKLPQHPASHSKKDFAYLSRIEELELNLRHQKENTNSMQDKLKERVVELEQALRATAATPRGTIIQENPLKTLLDRNQTLVKEVRFADQTCVELSAKLSSGKGQNVDLREQVANLEANLDTEREKREDAEARLLRLQEETEAKKGSTIGEGVLHSIVRKLSMELGMDAPPSTEAPGSLLSTLESQIERLQRQVHTKVSSGEIEDVDSVEGEEFSRVGVENEFLGRQLGMAQQKLEEAKNDLHGEKSRYIEMEAKFKEESQNLKAKIAELERTLSRPQKNICSTTTLEQLGSDIQTSTASLVELHERSQVFLASNDIGSNEKAVIGMLQTALFRMSIQYRSLDNRVKELVDTYSERLLKLTKTVHFLGSSVTFETESVSSSSQSPDSDGSPRMDASLSFQQSSVRDDEMLELMEEARGPPTIQYSGDEETLSTLDYGSRLFIDDGTAESLTKGGASAGSTSEAEQWRQPLEAAIRECQRVRTHSSKLKQEIDSQKAIIQTLEKENGRLSLEASRTKEALNAAEAQIVELRSKATLSFEKDEQLKAYHEEKVQLESSLEEAQEALESATLRLREWEEKGKEMESMLRAAEKASTQLRNERGRLEAKLDSLESELVLKYDERLESLQQSHGHKEQMYEDLNSLHNDALAKVADLSEQKLKLESLVSELRASEGTRLSEAEDKVLESQFQLENVRKERAELRSKLARKEKDLESVKQEFDLFQTRAEDKASRKDAATKALQAELSDIISQAEVLKGARYELVDELEKIDMGADLARTISSADRDSFLEGDGRCVQELTKNVDLLRAVAHLVPSLSLAAENAESLSNELAEAKFSLLQQEEAEQSCRKQLEEESQQNENLFALLRQAELEMERSATQIREMSSALSKLQEQESIASDLAKETASDLSSTKQELLEAREAAKQERQEANARSADLVVKMQSIESQLAETREKLRLCETDVGVQSQTLSVKEEETDRLRLALASAETKCARLRDYVRKLTTKCEEWESSYDKQSKFIDKLQTKNRALKERTAEAMDRYRRLSSDVKRRKARHHEDRAQWKAEKSNIQDVHVRLEEELESIAKELGTVDNDTTE